MNRISWQWLAGFTDGDGCIHLAKRFSEHPSQIHVSWYQSERQIEILDAIVYFLEEQGFEPKRYCQKKDGMTFEQTAPLHTVTLRGALQCQRVLKELLPFLMSAQKAERAQQALDRLEGFDGTQKRRKKQVCKHGHDLSLDANVYVHSKTGDRHCVPCRRDTDKRRRQKERQACCA